MNAITHAKGQVTGLYLLVFKALLAYTLFFVVVSSLAFFVFHIRLDSLTRDPAAVLHGKFYTGALSNLNILFWTASVTLCLAGYFALAKLAPQSVFKKLLLHFGLATGILLLDDLYMWHEEMFPKYIGLHEYFVYAGYLTYFAAILVLFRKTVLKSDYIILALAFAFLGASMMADVFCNKLIYVLPALEHCETFIEDALKSMGIFTWLLYFVRLLFGTVLAQIEIALVQRQRISTRPKAVKKSDLKAEAA